MASQPRRLLLWNDQRKSGLLFSPLPNQEGSCRDKTHEQQPSRPHSEFSAFEKSSALRILSPQPLDYSHDSLEGRLCHLLSHGNRHSCELSKSQVANKTLMRLGETQTHMGLKQDHNTQDISSPCPW